jgi:hypothetical protein
MFDGDGTDFDMGCMAPQSFAAGGNRSYQELWVLTSHPRYPGYKTPTHPLPLDPQQDEQSP